MGLVFTHFQDMEVKVKPSGEKASAFDFPIQVQQLNHHWPQLPLANTQV